MRDSNVIKSFYDAKTKNKIFSACQRSASLAATYYMLCNIPSLFTIHYPYNRIILMLKCEKNIPALSPHTESAIIFYNDISSQEANIAIVQVNDLPPVGFSS